MTDLEKMFLHNLTLTQAAREILTEMIESRDTRIDELVREVNELAETA